MKEVLLAVAVIAGAVQAQPLPTTAGEIAKRVHALPVKSCEAARPNLSVVISGGKEVPASEYECKAGDANTSAIIYGYDDGYIDSPKEIVSFCTKLKADDHYTSCTQPFIVARPASRAKDLVRFNTISFVHVKAEARYAYLYQGGQPFVDERLPHGTPATNRYAEALSACNKDVQEGDKKSFTWVGLLKSNGKFAYTDVEPKTPLSTCVAKLLLISEFPKPPNKKFDKLGGYPLTFNFPYGDFDGGPTQGLPRKEEEKYFVPPECHEELSGSKKVTICK